MAGGLCQPYSCPSVIPCFRKGSQFQNRIVVRQNHPPALRIEPLEVPKNLDRNVQPPSGLIGRSNDRERFVRSSLNGSLLRPVGGLGSAERF